MIWDVPLSLDKNKWIWKFVRESKILVAFTYLVQIVYLISTSATFFGRDLSFPFYLNQLGFFQNLGFFLEIVARLLT